MAGRTNLTQKYRIGVSRGIAVLAVLLVLFTGHSWTMSVYADLAVDLCSFTLVLTATFGRLWALAYIGGHKSQDLITTGPYSIVRNPLYLFSFIGAMGVALSTLNVLVVALVIAQFGMYYPFVILGEERRLRDVHGSAFEKYLARVPMIIPKFSLYRDEPSYAIDTRLFRRSFFSVVWFPLIYLAVQMIDTLHASGAIPVLLTIP